MAARRAACACADFSCSKVILSCPIKIFVDMKFWDAKSIDAAEWPYSETADLCVSASTAFGTSMFSSRDKFKALLSWVRAAQLPKR